MLNYKLYLNSNSKKYILLLHCICGNLNIFEKQIKVLKESYNILLIDLPFHGKSISYNNDLTFFNISSDIIHILDKYNIDKVTIIGLSLGSCISNYIYYYFENRVERIIFASVANGLSNAFMNKLFHLFTKINLILPTNLYLKLLIFFIIPQKNNKYYRKLFFVNGKNMGKENLRNYLKLLNEHFINYRKFIKNHINSAKIHKIYLMGENDYVFKKCVKKSVLNDEYNRVIFLSNQSHMLDLDNNVNFSKLCTTIINSLN